MDIRALLWWQHNRPASDRPGFESPRNKGGVAFGVAYAKPQWQYCHTKGDDLVPKLLLLHLKDRSSLWVLSPHELYEFPYLHFTCNHNYDDPVNKYN
ncbi:hypothetical protein J6590_047546 [Homalodisca vitripennis]|nr:hypothetical protein J6590_047546 [Homalodisca vitripennis]